MDDDDQHQKLKEYNIQPGRCTKRFLHAGDTFISLFLISPLVILHWRSTWALMDYYGNQFPPWNCMIYGMLLHTTIALLREFLYEQCSKSSRHSMKTWHGLVFRYIFTKFYAYVFSMGCNMHWRGGWAVIDMYLGK